jgi:hypothetical protein
LESSAEQAFVIPVLGGAVASTVLALELTEKKVGFWLSQVSFYILNSISFALL